LTQLPNPDGVSGSLIDAIDLVVPHQANKNMVLTLAEAAGIPGDRIFFNIERMGNTSSASILLAVHDAVREGRIDRPMRVFRTRFRRRCGWRLCGDAGGSRDCELKF
jgi:3-oxoacyl-[acyl-carrier-protein] synthase III